MTATLIPRTFEPASTFGIVGDGSTDNTTAIGTALTQLSDAGGGTLYIPRGDYRYSSIDKTVSNVRITGDGSSSILKSTLPVDTSTIAFNLDGDNLTLESLAFDHVTPVTVDVDAFNRHANPQTVRLGKPAGTARTGATLSKLKVRNSRNSGISVLNYSDPRIVFCDIKTCLGNGIYTSDCATNVWIMWNAVEDTGDDSIAVLADGNLPALTENAWVLGNSCKKTYANGIDFSGVDGGFIDFNTVDTTWANGLFCWHDTGDSLGTVKNVDIGDHNVLRDIGTYYGADQFKTTVNSDPYPIKIANDVDGITVGYPRVVNPPSGSTFNNGLTGTGVVRRLLSPQRTAAGAYIRTTGVTISTVTPAEGTATACPVWVGEATTATTMNVKVTGAGSTSPDAQVRLGIYRDSGSYAPGTLVLDAGTVTCTSTGLKTSDTFSQPLIPGLYWLVAVCQNSAVTRPTVNCLSGQAPVMVCNQDPATNINGYTAGSVSAALPSSFSVNGTTSQAIAISLGF